MVQAVENTGHIGLKNLCSEPAGSFIQLSQRTSVPVATGDIHNGWEVVEFLKARAIQVVQRSGVVWPDVMNS